MPQKPSTQRSPREPKPEGKRARKRTDSRRQAARHQHFGDRAPDDGDRTEPQRRFLTGPQVEARYSITDMSLWRWLKNPALAFPQPTLVVHGRRYWDEEVLRQWELQRIARRAAKADAGEVA